MEDNQFNMLIGRIRCRINTLESLANIAARDFAKTEDKSHQEAYRQRVGESSELEKLIPVIIAAQTGKLKE